MTTTYKYSGQGNCRGCNEPILWFVTPRGKSIPITRSEFIAEHGAISLSGLQIGAGSAREMLLPFTHWKSCKAAHEFRGKGRR